MNCVLFAKMDQIFSKGKQSTKKILENWKKILEKSGKSQGILSVRKSGNPDFNVEVSSQVHIFPSVIVYYCCLVSVKL